MNETSMQHPASVENIRICLVGSAAQDSEILQCAEKFRVPVLLSETGVECLNDEEWTTYFILTKFEGPSFEKIYKTKHKILGPSALKDAANSNEGLPRKCRPLYNNKMRDVFIVFSGLRKKQELVQLVNYIHYMGGSIRRDLGVKVTHVISNSSIGEKYSYAMTFGLHALRPQWVVDAWKSRDNPAYNPNSAEVLKEHRLKVFENQRICFFGFSPEEHQHMEDVLRMNGGIPTNIEDPECSHIIMADSGKSFSNHNISFPSTSFLPNENPETDDLDCSLSVFPLPRSDENARPSLSHMSESLKRDIEERNEEEDEFDETLAQDTGKRKRIDDSFDNISIVSTDSLAPNQSISKKPRLFRTGSISKTLRRSISFSLKTPLANVFSSRRNSVADPNVSITSTSSLTFGTFTKKKSKKAKAKADPCESPVSSRAFLETDDTFKTPLAPSSTPTPKKCVTKAGDQTNKPKLDSSASTHELNSSLMSLNPLTAPDAAETRPVVDEHTIQLSLEAPNSKTHIVKSDWFWYTIQNGFADEKEYSFKEFLKSMRNEAESKNLHESIRLSFNKRKRKRPSHRLLSADGTPVSLSGKRRSSVSDAGLLSVSGSLLDYTASPADSKHEKYSDSIAENVDRNGSILLEKAASMRHNHFNDFFYTESNYVGILETIVKVFKEPLENMLESNPETALLNQTELKSIFNNFLPIYEVHKMMLKGLSELQSRWTEECLIGQIILDNKEGLIRAYPPYINFFEQMKETLVQCDTSKPRFHAFLKICQAKPECGRQSLQDLMIRPVQRLPSISLLLNDIIKHTDKSNPDHKKLEEALQAIKEVNAYINEDKRRTECQLAIFDIFNEIEQCPADLISSHRVLISRCEVYELSEAISGRGDYLVLFLFSDTLYVCKRRSGKGPGSVKSPSSTLNTKLPGSKQFKFLMSFPLSAIRNVIDIKDDPRAFSLLCRVCGENKDRLYAFSICDSHFNKMEYLKSLCRQIAENTCQTDAEKSLFSCPASALNIDTSDVTVGTLSKAFKFATRTRLKVGRAFSFNKTPSKLKRAVSTMMTTPFGSANPLTPSTQMAQMKLASCTSLNECNTSKEEDSDTSCNLEKEVSHHC